MIRKILPKHVMPSYYQMQAEQAESAKRYGDKVRFNRTMSGCQADLSKLMPLVIISNLLQFAIQPASLLTNNVYILCKLLIDGCNVQYIYAHNLILAHINLVFLPVDKEVMMTDLYSTDKERRDNNPAGQLGISFVCDGCCLPGQGELWQRACKPDRQRTPSKEGSRALIRAVPAKCES